MKILRQKLKLFTTLICIAIGLIGISRPAFSKLSGSLSEEAITERLKPEGQVEVSGVQAASNTNKSLSPKAVFNKYCSVCHKTGVLGAPKVGDKADWDKRMQEGMDAVLKKAINGFNNMPAKGTCMNCTDDEIKQTIEFMLQ